MSQVHFKTTLNGKNIEVVGGWDRPLQSYHFTIYDLDSEEKEVLYCNTEDSKLFEFACFTPTNEHFKAVCGKMGLELPEHFWILVSLKAGNLQLFWHPITERYEER